MTVIQVNTAEQRRAVRWIRERVFVEEQGVPRELEYDEHDATAIHLLVLDENGRPVATGRTRPYDEDKMKVERVATIAALRGKGFGYELMSAMERVARREGRMILTLGAQVQAIPFYERLGYSIVSEEFEDAGIPHRTMEKRIEEN
ncbi:GNAT family N-acetyltransferase [Exiguobacterium flavidum]|uniref:GNAT family N-acetyltransferase n=1 Tax=Exiguobacterium flavidum TaxID=2184695 RepID=UPI000DF83ED8|nr:GNAT family N-acetyltransferase [Exiguobacterium flavidum]